jgi:hypothetical protein
MKKRKKEIKLPLPLGMSFTGTYNRFKPVGDLPVEVMLEFLNNLEDMLLQYERYTISEFEAGIIRREGLCMMIHRTRTEDSRLSMQARKAVGEHLLQFSCSTEKYDYIADYVWQDYNNPYDPIKWYAPRIKFVNLLIKFYKRQSNGKRPKIEKDAT